MFTKKKSIHVIFVIMLFQQHVWIIKPGSVNACLIKVRIKHCVKGKLKALGTPEMLGLLGG